MEVDYYGAINIQEITGCKKSYAYDLIRKLQNSFKEDYPDGITIQGRIPIWYFEEKMLNRKKEN